LDGQQRTVGIKTKQRLLGGGLSYAFAKAICARVGTNLDVLFDSVLEIRRVYSNRTRQRRNELSEAERQALNVPELAKKSYFDSPSIYGSSMAEVAEAIIAESDYDAVPAALSTVRGLNAFTATSLDQEHPGVGQLLRRATGVETFQRLDPMDNPPFARTFSRIIESQWPLAERLMVWADFLPCSIETPAFMRAHHLGLFTALTGRFLTPEDALNIADTFNAMGDMNRERFHARLSTSQFTYEVFLSTDTITNIGSRRGAFKGVSPEHLVEQLEYLRRLSIQYGEKIAIWQLSKTTVEHVEREAAFEGMDSVFFLKGATPLHAAKRSRRGQVEIVLDQVRLRRMLDWFDSLKQESSNIGLLGLTQRLKD
jgi:hypothetical protein